MPEALDCKLRITLPAAKTKHASEFAKKIVEQRHLADDPALAAFQRFDAGHTAISIVGARSPT
jgi:hypothetical protein